ncbi:DUF2147 domain-containing protein [Croceicoccus sp. F390]|uniref:DUF2147 domain-containing protein n=1 Tax=Croceicoccus esteveae TaxID=3075597 RepID=A0ABU2ZH32_9SPHN|nr:DUF2147 domain-containing protein [Croceicoccus sp. F390]MDT0575908.1 DUF2147 domain-containing protein [Croceicoccus sp. F390]
MHKLILSAAMLIGCASAVPAHGAEPITGRWTTQDGKAVITIAQCGEGICGRVSKILKGPPGGPPLDRNNPDEGLRKRPVLGIKVLSGFTDEGKDWRGRIYDPEGGKWYKSIVERDGNILKAKGCVLFVCRTQRWTSAN